MTPESALQIASLLNSQNQLTIPYTAQNILSDESLYLVKYGQSEEVLGAAEVKKVQWYQCEILHVTVSPVARRQGIGTWLVREAEKRAIELGARIVQCTIRTRNQESEGLFQKLGYDRTVTFHNADSGNDVGVYEKVLDNPRAS